MRLSWNFVYLWVCLLVHSYSLALLLFCTQMFRCSKFFRTEPEELSLSTDPKLQIHFTWLMMIYGVGIVVVGGGGIAMKIKSYKRRKTWNKNHAWAMWRYGDSNSATNGNQKKTNNNEKRLLMDEKSKCSRDNDMLLFAVLTEKCGGKRSSAKREKARKRHTQRSAAQQKKIRITHIQTKANQTKLN